MEAKTEGGPGVTDQAPLLRHLLSAAQVCEHGGLPRSLEDLSSSGEETEGSDHTFWSPC